MRLYLILMIQYQYCTIANVHHSAFTIADDTKYFILFLTQEGKHCMQDIFWGLSGSQAKAQNKEGLVRLYSIW